MPLVEQPANSPEPQSCVCIRPMPSIRTGLCRLCGLPAAKLEGSGRPWRPARSTDDVLSRISVEADE